MSTLDPGANSKLVVLHGGMTVHGSWSFDNQVNNWRYLRYIATTLPQYPTWPRLNLWVKIAEKSFNVPSSRNGNFIIAKTRAGCADDKMNSIFFLRLRIDDIEKGSMDVQKFYPPDTISTRQMGASYLSANSPLSSGLHKASVGTYVETQVANAYITNCGYHQILFLLILINIRFIWK